MGEEVEGVGEGGAGGAGGGGDGRGGAAGQEDGGDGGEGGDDGDVEGHGWYIGGLAAEEGVDQLAKGAAEGVREGGDGGGGDAAAGGEPDIRVLGWGAEDEGLGEAGEDLPEHDDAESGRGGACAGIADPVPQQDEEGSGDEGEARTARVEGIDGCGRGDNKGEEEGRGEPIDDALIGGEECSCCAGYGGEGEPLSFAGQPNWFLLDVEVGWICGLTSQLTMMFKRTSWNKPNHLILYTL